MLSITIFKKILALLTSLVILGISEYSEITNKKITQEDAERKIEELTKIDIKSYSEADEIKSLIELANPEEEPRQTELFNILGIGKSDNLTDALIVASINAEKEKISLISIPRDLFLDGLKVNHFHFYYGVEKLKKEIERITGLGINRYILVNFDGFRALINAIGGIDIKVEQEIKDSTYDYSIEPGEYHFTGQQALRFSRSRFSTSDFDRANRQQKVLGAVITKLKEFDFLKNPEKAFEIYNSLKKNFETDISIWEAIDLYDKYKNFNIIRKNVLSTDNYLYGKVNENQAYVLLPKTGDFKQIQKFIKELVH